MPDNQVDILITRQFPSVAEDLLRSAGFRLSVWSQDRPMTTNELLERAPACDALLCTITDRIDENLLAACPRLKMISQFGVGYDNIDIAAATKRKIPVGNTPDVLTDATADTAFALLLSVARKTLFNYQKILRGEWKTFEPNKHLGIELKGKTLGIFGMGRIGVEMARRCVGAYGMQVLYHNRRRNAEAEQQLGARLVSFDELLQQSDIVSVHSVLSNETRDIFNATAFARMKKNAIFINTARGGIHNEANLISALREGTIWGAGLDVTNPEPIDPGSPLLFMENVAVLPHIGSATVEARSAMARIAATNLISFFRERRVPHIVNPGVLPS